MEMISALDAIFSAPKIVHADREHLAFIHNEAKRMTAEQKQHISEQLLQSVLAPDNRLPLLFFLYDCFGDVRFLERTLEQVPESPSISWFYEYYWNVSQRLFTRVDGSKKIHAVMRDKFYRLAYQTTEFLSQRRLITKKVNMSAPKHIAIISPQLLTMRHSPTREAFNIALHLAHHHDCQVYIINTNGMIYEGCNQLNLIMPAVFQTNNELVGQKLLPVNYLQFNSSVNTISFEAGPMSSQKIAQIINVLQQLGIEAVIGHGENLLVMESLYGYYPSLFATTGAVVPYNHCNAYFVPGKLFDQRAQALAKQYQHDNFMMESMLVTPEGEADKPALRAQFDLRDEDFLFLVVGMRLGHEIDKDFCDAITRLLRANANAKVLFAGSTEFEVARYFEDSLLENAKVLNIGFQNDLPAISAMCDVYLNPKRNGGGTSAQTALLNGLPVVTLDQGHISAILPAEKRHSNWNSYINYANRLQTDSAFLQHEAEFARQFFIDNLDSAAQVARMYQQLAEIAIQ